MKRKRQLMITDDFGDVSNRVFDEEIKLLMPYADELLKPILKKKTKGAKHGKKK